MVSESTISRRRNGPTLEQIHESSLNEDKMQAVDQIRRYGVADFFQDYGDWLSTTVDPESEPEWGQMVFEHYKRVVNWYHGRKIVRHG